MALSLINLSRGLSRWWSKEGGLQEKLNQMISFSNDLETQISTLTAGSITNDLVFTANTQTESDNASITNMGNCHRLAMTTSGKYFTLLNSNTQAYEGLRMDVFNNGAETFGIKDNSGSIIVAALKAGEMVILELIDNATAAGDWQVYYPLRNPQATETAIDATDRIAFFDASTGLMKDITRDDLVKSADTPTITVSAGRTLAATDAGAYLRFTGSTSQTITIDDAVFAAGDEIVIKNATSNTFTLEAGTGVTVNGVLEGSLIIDGYAAFLLKAVSASLFDFSGSGEDLWS